jgi:hypothetical protein
LQTYIVQSKLAFLNILSLTTSNLLGKFNSKTNIMQTRYNLIRVSAICSLSLLSYVTFAAVTATAQSYPSRNVRTKKRMANPKAPMPALTRSASEAKELGIEISPNEIMITPQDSLAPLVAKGKVAMQQRKDSIMKANAQAVEPALAAVYIPPAEVRPTPAPVTVLQEVATEPELLVAKGDATTLATTEIEKNDPTHDTQHAEPELQLAKASTSSTNATTSEPTTTQPTLEQKEPTQDMQHREPALKLDNNEANKTDFTAKGGAAVTTPATQVPMKGIPWMVFDNNRESVDLGNVRLGERPSHTFIFTNQGDTDLEIELVSSCECTIIEHSKDKVAPGASGFIKATFNSSAVYPEGVNRLNEKEITIILKNTYPTNGYPIVKTLLLKAFVQ